MTVYIPLSGKVVGTILVDDDDAELARQYRWYGDPTGSSHGGYYARGHIRRSDKMIYLHRLLLKPDKGVFVDHIDFNGLNNCRSNLRLCTHGENQAHRRIYRNPHGFRGVAVRRGEAGFFAKIRANGKEICRGGFLTVEEAAREYDRLAILHHGSFAVLNFPDAIPPSRVDRELAAEALQ